MNMTKAAELLHVTWRSLQAIIERVIADLGGKTDRLAGLRRIGIDELSYRKGQRLRVRLCHRRRACQRVGSVRVNPAIPTADAVQMRSLAKPWQSRASLHPRSGGDLGATSGTGLVVPQPHLAGHASRDIQRRERSWSSCASCKSLTSTLSRLFEGSDLATYRSTYGLPACTTANGCFRKVGQNGGTSYPAADAGWAAEISLDLDMVSAICPHCHILLAEASSSELSDLGAAVNRAVSLGARFVSNSYGGDESASDIGYDSKFFNHPGVAITVSAGDSGYGVSYPAASRYVTAVGGTSLKPGSNARGWTETVWGGGSGGGTGSGCSADDAKPTWQKDTGCTRRTIADVAAVADPNTGVAVYDTYQANGWAVYGGTSVASPIIAAVYALAGTPTRGSYPASYPYAHAPAELNNVTSGSDGSCSPAYLCMAGPGYNGPTGLGTPDGYTAFTAP